MDFGSMKRKKLQALCKKHGIPANLTNLEMADRLSSFLKGPEKTNDPNAQEQLAASNLMGYENEMDAKEGPCNAKKVRFSPENEMFIFVPLNVKTSVKPKWITRSRLPGKASKKRIDSWMRSTKSRAQDLAKKVVVVDVPPVTAEKRTRRSRGRNMVESTGNNQERSDGAVDAENCQIELESIVPRKRAGEDPFNRSKSTKNVSRHFVAPSETANSSMEHQRDYRGRQRKKLEPQKNNGEVFTILDKKLEELKISGRVTRSRSMMIHENSLELAKISEVESQGEAGRVQQKEFPAKAARGNYKKPGTIRKNLRLQNLVSSDCPGVDAGQGKSNGTKSISLMLETVESQIVEPTVNPAKVAPHRRSKRKPPLSAVLGNDNFPVEVVDRKTSLQKQEDSLRVEVPQKTLLSEPQMGLRPVHEEPLTRSGRQFSNATQLDPAQVNFETGEKKLETGSGAFISEEVSSTTLPSEAQSSLHGGLYHVKKHEMKNHVENSEENFDGEISVGPKTASMGGYADQKIQQLASHIIMGSEQLDSFSEDCERDFPVNLHNQSSPPNKTEGGSCPSLSSFHKGSEAEQLSVMKYDSSSGTMERDDQDYWNGDRVSEIGMSKPADKVDNHHLNEDEPVCGCETTQHQMRNLALQTEASRVAVQDIPDIQTKIACPNTVAGTHMMGNEDAIESGPQNSCPTASFVGQRKLRGQEFDLGRLEIFDEALCSETDRESLLNERWYNQNNIAEAIDKQSANQDEVMAVGPLTAVLHMDARNECPQSLSPGRNSVGPRKYEAQSSGQQDGHPQGSDYASNQIQTDTWIEFLGDTTSTLEGKSIDMTNRKGTPRLVENQSSDKQKVLDENKEGSGTCSLDLHFNWGETDGGSFANPQTNPDASLHQGCIITEKMSDLSFGISSPSNHTVGGDDAEAFNNDHPKKLAVDAHRDSTCPARASGDQSEHLERTCEDDIDRSGGLSGGQCDNALSVNDVRPYFNIETCGEYHLPKVAADLNVETFSETETSIDRQNYTGEEQENKEEFSSLSRSLASVREKTGDRILHHCAFWKKVNNSSQEDMKKNKRDQVDLEDGLAWLDQELLSTKVSGDHISQVQTDISGLAHSDHEKWSSKGRKSVMLHDQGINEHTGKTPQASLGGSFGESLEILQMGECRQRISTPEQDAVISKDEIAITSPSAPKSSKVKSFIRQDIKVITNLADENSNRSMFSKRTSFLENCEESTSQIDHNSSSAITELEAKLTSPTTLSEEIRTSKCSGVEVALVEDVQWLERALLDDTYNCAVECTKSSGSASEQEETDEAHSINVQENAEITTIQNALIFVSDSDHDMNAGLAIDEKTKAPLDARSHFELGQGEIKSFAAEGLFPLFQEEPECDQRILNLGSNASQKIEDKNVELNIQMFTETEEENEVGAEKTDSVFGLHNSENQPLLPCVEPLSDDSKDADKQNDSHMLADEVQASDRMDESRPPHTHVSCTPVLSLVNSANQDFSKFSDVQVEDPTFTCVRSRLLGDSLVSLEASDKSTDNQNVRFEIENVMEVPIHLLKVQETLNVEERANDTGIADSVSEKHALADDLLARDIKGLMDDQETTASAMIHEYMGRGEDDETRTVLKSSIRHNEGQIYPYSDADYLPAGVLFSESRDCAADPSSKQTARTDVAKTPLRTAPMVSDMKENTSNIHKVRAPTTTDASKTWTKRRALDPLPNK